MISHANNEELRLVSDKLQEELWEVNWYLRWDEITYEEEICT
jgi:hypothetical protein